MIFEAIRTLREERGLSQAQVAAILGVAQNTYSQYETGKIEWTAPVLLRLADYYQVSVDFLVARTQNPKLPG